MAHPHFADDARHSSRHPSDAATWIKTIHDGIDGALRVWSVELQAAQRSNHTEAVSLIVARCEEIRDWQERVAPNLARVWGRPSAERITQRFVNAHALLENLTGWPLRETFVLVRSAPSSCLDCIADGSQAPSLISTHFLTVSSSPFVAFVPVFQFNSCSQIGYAVDDCQYWAR
ncbi:hypothetical protein BJY59DRAFT_221597 [Rhodotorula toruloides]